MSEIVATGPDNHHWVYREPFPEGGHIAPPDLAVRMGLSSATDVYCADCGAAAPLALPQRQPQPFRPTPLIDVLAPGLSGEVLARRWRVYYVPDHLGGRGPGPLLPQEYLVSSWDSLEEAEAHTGPNAVVRENPGWSALP